jgi:hypothetical protein
MNTWFNTPERVQRLQFKAAKWIGTPFFSNGNTPGRDGGVSCQKLVGAIYREVGFADREIPEVNMGHAQFSATSLIEPFMKQLVEEGLFDRLDVTEPVAAGDLIALRIRRISHHLGIVLPGPTRPNMFIHAMCQLGTVLSSLEDPTYSGRLMAIWRPRLEQGS